MKPTENIPVAIIIENCTAIPIARVIHQVNEDVDIELGIAQQQQQHQQPFEPQPEEAFANVEPVTAVSDSDNFWEMFDLFLEDRVFETVELPAPMNTTRPRPAEDKIRNKCVMNTIFAFMKIIYISCMVVALEQTSITSIHHLCPSSNAYICIIFNILNELISIRRLKVEYDNYVNNRRPNLRNDFFFICISYLISIWTICEWYATCVDNFQDLFIYIMLKVAMIFSMVIVIVATIGFAFIAYVFCSLRMPTLPTTVS